MAQNLVVATSSGLGTLTLNTPVAALSFVASGSNPFYFGISSSATAQTANASSGSWIGGVPFTVRSDQKIQTVTFATVTTTNDMTVYVGINIASAAGN